VSRTRELPRGPLFIFRKIHLYGKTKKSTHGHQTTKPFCTHFSESACTDYFDQGESNGGGPVSVRGLQAEESTCVCVPGSRVGRVAYPVPTLDLTRSQPSLESSLDGP